MKRDLPLTVALTLLAGGVAQALGLGPLERRSALNQPFEARIPLSGASAEDLDSLRISLAGPDAFRRAGIERGLLATRLRFEVVQPPTGPDYIRVTTRDPVGEPFVSFLLEVNWATGRLFREYTALLDPPGFQRQPLQVRAAQGAGARPVPSPVPATPARVAASTAPPPARPVAAAPAAPTEKAPAERATAEPFAAEVRVDAGDTLWGLAEPLARRAGVSTSQALVALWRANPEAFIGGNMHALRAGAILRLPDSTVLAGLSNAEALAQMAQQNEAWQAYRSGRAAAPAPVAVVAPTTPPPVPAAPVTPAPPVAPSAAPAPEDPKLALLAPAPEDASRAGDAGLRKELDLTREEIESRAAENDELRARLDEAERLIAQLERVLEVRSTELARLQARLGGEPTPGPAAAVDTAAAPAGQPVGPAEAVAVAPDVAPAEAVEATPSVPEPTDPLAILERDLAASEKGADILPTDEAPAPPAVAPAGTVVDAPTGTPLTEPADPLAILERDLAASEEGADILPTDEATAPAAEPAADAPPAVTDPAADAPPAVTEPAADAPPAVTDPVADAPPVAPAADGVAAAPDARPTADPFAPVQDALTRWAESVVPPAIGGAMPGGPLAALAALGGVVLGLLGLLGARLGRRRRPVAITTAAQSTAARSGVAASEAAAEPEATLPATPASGLKSAAAVSAVVGGGAAVATGVDDTLTDLPLQERTFEATAAELAGPAPMAPEVDDLLTEVNVYLAYEQYDQAETLVRRAIAEAPGDPRRHQYLLDIFYAKGDVVAFEKAAATLRDLTGGVGAAWEDALKRWQELAPGRELFSVGATEEPFDVTAQRTFVDLTALDTRATPSTAGRPASTDTPVDLDPFAATATFAPGELTLAEIAGASAAPQPLPPVGAQAFDLDLSGASAEGVAGRDAFDELTADEGGLDFADEAHPATSPLPGPVTFDPSAGDDFSLIDITGGDARPAAADRTLVDITGGGAGATGANNTLVDITGGDARPTAADRTLVDITGGDVGATDADDTLVDITGGDAGAPGADLVDITSGSVSPSRAGHGSLERTSAGVPGADLIDITSGSVGPSRTGRGSLERTSAGATGADLIDITTSSAAASRADTGMLDITGGEAAVDASALHLSALVGDMTGGQGDATRGLDPSLYLLDVTATGAAPNRDLQDLLDVSLEGAGLGDLLDVSGPTAGSRGPLAGGAAQDLPGQGVFDMPLEFNVSGLAGEAGAPPADEGTLGLPALAALGGKPLALAGDRELADTFDRPQTALDMADDDGQSLDELAQALEETASRMKASPAVPDLADFSSTRADALRDTAGGQQAEGGDVPEFGDLGAIDFDLLGGAEDSGVGRVEDDALSLEDLEAALAASEGGRAGVSQGEDTGEFSLGDFSSADSWLNLAHAYIEIGDPASAREELERVLAQGNPEQQAQARELLEQIRD